MPATWEICDAVLLFKKGDASQPGNYRTIMKLVVQEKLLLTIIGERLHKVIESLGVDYENQQGFRGLRGCIDAVFNLRTHLRKRQEHGRFHHSIRSYKVCLVNSAHSTLRMHPTPDFRSAYIYDDRQLNLVCLNTSPMVDRPAAAVRIGH